MLIHLVSIPGISCSITKQDKLLDRPDIRKNKATWMMKVNFSLGDKIENGGD